MSEFDDKTPEEPSRTQLKNQAEALQELGKSLLALSKEQLDTIPLSDALRDAILLARSLKGESRRRQLQYIGKLMRHIDAQPIKLALRKIQFSQEKNIAHFHEIEAWRDKLIAKGDEAIQELLTVCPDADRQQLRQLLRKIAHDRNNATNTGGETELFRYLREVLPS